MKVLVITTMFPNPVQPVYAIFVQRRIASVARNCDVRIIAPTPYFPFAALLGRYRHRKGLPRFASVSGLEVSYPRFLSVPKLFKALDGWFLLLSLLWPVWRLRRTFDFDLIDTQLVYPEGFAGMFLARLFRRPFTVTLRGHDINVFPVKRDARGRQIRRTLARADRVMAVAEALARKAVEMGCPEDRIETVSNGVEAAIFHPGDRAAARRRLGLPLDRRIVVGVGNLVERKGFHIVLEAMRSVKRRRGDVFYYVIVGGPGVEGNVQGELRRRIDAWGLEEDVLLAGGRLNEELGDWYRAADVSCLASSKEGWANVLLESLACGTPVVATKVWGTPEVIRSSQYGILTERTPDDIAAALEKALARSWDVTTLVEYARGFTWERVGERVVANYHAALGRMGGNPWSS